MDKIVFTLNNRDIHHDYSAMAFLTVELLLQNPESGVHEFIKSLNSFTNEDFHRLNARIKDEHLEQVHMNEKHLIIFYAAVHYACMAHIDPAEKKRLQLVYREKVADLPLVSDKLLKFGAVVSEKFRKDFAHLKTFSKISDLISID